MLQLLYAYSRCTIMHAPIKFSFNKHAVLKVFLQIVCNNNNNNHFNLFNDHKQQIYYYKHKIYQCNVTIWLFMAFHLFNRMFLIF